MAQIQIIAWMTLTTIISGCQTAPVTHNDPVQADLSATDHLLKDNTPVVGSSVILVVHGMACPLCANNVNKTLMGIQGVDSAIINLEAGMVVVGIPGDIKPTRSELAKAVADSGYSLIQLEERP